MMNLKRISALALLLLFLSLIVPKPAQAIDFGEIAAVNESFVLRIQESVEYFFAFRAENRVRVLEKQAEKRLLMAQNQADEGNLEKVQNQIQNYLQIKNRQDGLLENIKDGEVLGAVAERTVEQQKTMEEIKNKIDVDGKEGIIQVQEQVVNQVAKHVVEVNGTEGTTEFLNEVIHVWAPGTGPGGGEAGVVYAGGGKVVYAEGTGPGGPGGVVIEGGEVKFATGASMDSPGADVKTVEVKTGGGGENPAPGTTAGDGGGMAPGTTHGGGGGNTIDSGGVDSGDTPDSKHWIAP